MGFLTAACILASGFFYVNEPVIDMRETPSNESRVASQTIFSERVTVQEESGDWSCIITPDGYSGWVPSKSLINCLAYYDPSITVARLRAHVYGIKNTEFGPIRSLPYGTRLKSLDASDPRWIKVALLDGLECYIQKGDVESEPSLLSKQDLILFSQKFLGLPYTWGGRSSFGYDCSGFVQMLYSHMGVHLQRDARQQILDSRFRVIELNELEPGDLVFFGRSPQKITHVGMSIGEGQFIHATAQENKPWIRISSLSDFEWSGNEKALYPYRTARQLMKKEN